MSQCFPSISDLSLMVALAPEATEGLALSQLTSVYCKCLRKTSQMSVKLNTFPRSRIVVVKREMNLVFIVFLPLFLSHDNILLTGDSGQDGTIDTLLQRCVYW